MDAKIFLKYECQNEMNLNLSGGDDWLFREGRARREAAPGSRCASRAVASSALRIEVDFIVSARVKTPRITFVHEQQQWLRPYLGFVLDKNHSL